MTVRLSKSWLFRFFLRNFRLLSPHYYTVIRSLSSAFQWSQNVWLWTTSRYDSRCFVRALEQNASASTISPPNSDKIVMWRFLLLCLHTIFRALIYWAHRAVILAIAWHLVKLCNALLFAWFLSCYLEHCVLRCIHIVTVRHLRNEKGFGERWLWTCIARSTCVFGWNRPGKQHPSSLKIEKCFQLQGGFAPLTRGFAPGPHWGLSPQTPIIGSRSARSPWAPAPLHSYFHHW